MAETETDTDERDEDDFGLDPRAVEAVQEAVEGGDAGRLDTIFGTLHAADIADLLEQIGATERQDLIALAPDAIDGDVLSELDEGIREEVIEALPHDVLSEAVRELDSDDVVDLIEDLEEPQQEMILGALPDSDRAAVEQSLTYPEHSAGRLMQREVVTAPEHWTVGEAIDFLRVEAELPDQFYHVILVDPLHHPAGYVTLGKILSSRRDIPLRSITEDSFRTISVLDEEGDVAYAFNQYHLISAPVVDEHDRLVGVITIDDAMAVLDEEHEEDVLRLAGVSDDSSISDGPVQTARQRLPWLVINLFTASISAFVISRFEHTIATLVALAALMPIVAGIGGNSGNQTITMIVRAIALGQIGQESERRLYRKELKVALINGLVWGGLLGLVAWWLYGDWRLGAVMTAAMTLNLGLAAAVGVAIPMTLQKLGRDPAVGGSVMVTAVTDSGGFFIFLGLATLFLL